MQRLAEYGILDRERKFWHPRKPECARSKSVFINIGLEYFHSVLMVLFLGIIFSLIILLCEKSLDYKKQKEENKKTPIIVYPFTL